MTLTTVAAEIARDRYGRPMIVPKGHTKAVPYTRATTFVSAYEDTFNLEKWKVRQAIIGMSLRPDLALSAAAHRDDKRKLDALAQEMLDAAASSSAATMGTALHALTEQLDRGMELVGIPADAAADVAAYGLATADLKAIHIEQLTVHDPYRVAGTPDRVVSYKGKRYIADLKTGDIEYGAGKIAAQLAMYARSTIYHPATGEREEHGAQIDRGLVIHLPAGSATCEVKWIDLLAGWEIVRTCRDVRDRRKLKASDLYEPFGASLKQTVAESIEVNLEAKIRACRTADGVRKLWAQHSTSWNDALTAAAKQHIDSLAASAARSGETEGATS